MDVPKFTVKTTMEKEDYRKFLYIAAFFRNKTALPMIAVISLIGSLFINLNSTEINWLWLTITWILLFALSVVAICLKVEIKNKQRISTDKTGTFGTVNTLEFYDDKVVIRNESLNSTGELKYSQFYELLESSDYFIFYLNMNQASLIRKMDVDNIEDFKLFIKSKFANNYKCMA